MTVIVLCSIDREDTTTKVFFVALPLG